LKQVSPQTPFRGCERHGTATATARSERRERERAERERGGREQAAEQGKEGRGFPGRETFEWGNKRPPRGNSNGGWV